MTKRNQREKEIEEERKRERKEEANCEGGRDKRSQIQNKITRGYGGGGGNKIKDKE